MTDEGCICRGNWRAIISDVGFLIGQRFVDSNGKDWIFFGVVHADDDYYYGMWNKERGLLLVSCVGSMPGMGYELTSAETLN